MVTRRERHPALPQPSLLKSVEVTPTLDDPMGRRRVGNLVPPFGLAVQARNGRRYDGSVPANETAYATILENASMIDSLTDSFPSRTAESMPRDSHRQGKQGESPDSRTQASAKWRSNSR